MGYPLLLLLGRDLGDLSSRIVCPVYPHDEAEEEDDEGEEESELRKRTRDERVGGWGI